MTGKELFLCLGGATVVGGAGGMAATVAARPEPAPMPVLPDTTALQKRVEDLEKALRETARERDELHASVAAVRKDLDAASAVVAAGAGKEGAPVFGGRVPTEAEWEGAARQASLKLQEALKGMELELKDGDFFGGEVLLAGEDGALQAATNELKEGTKVLGERLKGIASGLRLRALPEEERWKKASEDLGLGEGQVADLKRAIADRDRAMEESMVTEKATNDAGAGALTVRRMDPEKAAAANRDYADRLDATLTPDQRKKWGEGGYDHAFGSMHGAGAGSMVMTIEVDHVEDGTKGGDGK